MAPHDTQRHAVSPPNHAASGCGSARACPFPYPKVTVDVLKYTVTIHYNYVQDVGVMQRHAASCSVMRRHAASRSVTRHQVHTFKYL